MAQTDGERDQRRRPGAANSTSRAALAIVTALMCLVALAAVWFAVSFYPPSPNDTRVTTPVPPRQPGARPPDAPVLSPVPPTPSPDTRSMRLPRASPTPSARPAPPPLPPVLEPATGLPAPSKHLRALPPLESTPTLHTAAPSTLVFERETAAIRSVLGQFADAYARLDARAAVSVWPSVDSRRLTAIFDRLREQRLEFSDCRFAIAQHDAIVTCEGELHYVPRVGSPTPQSERHAWTIYLEGEGENWRIVNVTAE